MANIKEFFNDIFAGAVFAVTMAIDVSRLLKEERNSEKLCLYVD